MSKSNLTTPEKPVLVLRVCGPDGGSTNGFYWPLIGPVNCPDWEDNKECGHGLHGWLHGVGDGYAATFYRVRDKNSIWMVVEVPSYIDLEGKVKFPSGTVVFSGTKVNAIEYLRSNDPYHLAKEGNNGSMIIGDIVTSTGPENVVGADYSVVTSESLGHSISGYMGESSSGEAGFSESGRSGISISGNHGRSVTADFGTAISGDSGAAISGNGGFSISGHHGYSLAKIFGTSISGDYGISIAYHSNNSSSINTGFLQSGIGGSIGTSENKLLKIGIDTDIKGDILIPNELYCFNVDDDKPILAILVSPNQVKSILAKIDQLIS